MPGDSKPPTSHAHTWLLQSALEAASSSALIATWPRIAHTSSVRDVESVDSSPLYRSVSCGPTGSAARRVTHARRLLAAGGAP
eukprot:361219-Chlamydomonas_euryale.AAC.3